MKMVVSTCGFLRPDQAQALPTVVALLKKNGFEDKRSLHCGFDGEKNHYEDNL